jgi:glycosyltransferase involved in cell wall biosynthesis
MRPLILTCPPYEGRGGKLMSLLHRLWRVLPRRLRREALFSAMGFIAPRPTPDMPFSMPVTVAGYHSATTGLGEAARLLTTLLAKAGLPLHVADLSAVHRQGGSARLDPGPAGPGTLLVHVNGPMLPWAMRALGRNTVRGKRVVAFWAWELPDLPPDWIRGLAFAHEIWVPSVFVADAVRRMGARHVRILPYPIPLPAPAPLQRSNFGLPDDAFVTLTMLNPSSSVARKNPLAAVLAHRIAFGEQANRLLVIKVHDTQNAGAAWRDVADAVRGIRNIVVIDRLLTRGETWALQSHCDVLLSLHRSEGFGLTLAETMRLGKPIVATGWSGNLDFMPNGSALLVPWRLVPARDPQKIYDMPGTNWAEADIGAAAKMLRELAENPATRLRIGEAARIASEQLSFARLATQLRDMLEMTNDEGLPRSSPPGLESSG